MIQRGSNRTNYRLVVTLLRISDTQFMTTASGCGVCSPGPGLIIRNRPSGERSKAMPMVSKPATYWPSNRTLGLPTAAPLAGSIAAFTRGVTRSTRHCAICAKFGNLSTQCRILGIAGGNLSVQNERNCCEGDCDDGEDWFHAFSGTM